MQVAQTFPAYFLNSALNRQIIDNGNFCIAQRGLEVGLTEEGMTLDRWSVNINDVAPAYIVSQVDLDLDDYQIATQSHYLMNVWVDSIIGATADVEIKQRVYGLRRFSNQTISGSVLMRYISYAGQMNVKIYSYFGSGGTPSPSLVQTKILNIGGITDLTRLEFNFDIPDYSSKSYGTNNDDYLMLSFEALDVEADDEIILGEVQLNYGEAGLTFQDKGFVAEYNACLQYFQRIQPLEYGNCAMGITKADYTSEIMLQFSPKRIIPVSITLSDLAGWSVTNTQVSDDIISCAVLYPSLTGCVLRPQSSTHNLLNLDVVFLRATSDLSYIDIETETL
jgi:hypothetical protein